MKKKIKWVVSVPSLRRPKLVKSFAERLANRLNIEYSACVVKVKETAEQKTMNNSNMQGLNLVGVFDIDEEKKVYKKPVLLIDDIVDSGWTLTVIGALLRKSGVSQVFPFALSRASIAGI